MQKSKRTRTTKKPESEEKDNRTISDILFPNPYKHHPPVDQFVWPNSFAVWRNAFSMAWKDYQSTWVGFTKSTGFSSPDKEKEKQNKKAIEKTTEDIKTNVRRNAEFLKEEAENLRKQVRERTGINSREDLQRWAADMMRLANDSVRSFMDGYRKGRDDEVEKMLTQYFQSLEEKANKPKRRKIKRRIRNPRL